MNGRSRHGRLFSLPHCARSRRGSLAVFFCIALAGLVMVLGSWLQAARVRAAEAELARAMAAQIDVSLAAYDQDLYSQFGLFAFDSAKIDRTVFAGSLPAGLQDCPLELDGRERITDQPVLDSQIVRRMKTRLPGAVFDLFVTRLAGFSDALPALIPTVGKPLTDSSVANAVSVPDRRPQPGYQTAAVRDNQPISGLEDLFQQVFRKLAVSAVRQTAGRLFDKLLKELEEDLIGDIRKQYRQFASERLAVTQAEPVRDMLGGMPDFLSPGSLTTMAGALDRLLDFSTAPLYEKFCVVEYLMAYCTPRAPVQVIDGRSVDLETPDGRSLAALAVDRPSEIEQFITGIEDPALAAGTVRFILISVRSLLHLAAILTDQTRMAAIRGTAATLAGAVAAISAGTVVIDPEPVAYLIAAAEALAAGIRESSRLIAGQGVRFWPGKGQVSLQLWYGDYLRLLLYCLPRATLIQRFSRCLDRLHPDTLHTALTVRTTLAGRSYALSGGYDR